MKVACKITNEDLIKFNIQHLSKLPRIKRLQKRNGIIIGSLYGIIAVTILIVIPEYWGLSWIILFFGILWNVFYPKAWERKMTKKLRKIFKDHSTKNQELEFCPTGILAQRDSYKGEILWDHILKVVENTEYLFFYLDKENAIILPRRDAGNTWEKILDYTECYFKNERKNYPEGK